LFKHLLFLAALSLALPACSSDKDERRETPDNPPIKKAEPIPLSVTESSFASSCNDFSFNLFRQRLAADTENKGVVISPLSVAYVLGMVNAGASGTTCEEITTALGFGKGDKDAVNAFCAKMIEWAPKVDTTVTIQLANAFYYNSNNPSCPVVINADYAATIAKFYEAQLQGLNFASSSAAGVINGWCNQHTNGMIPKIIDETKAEAVAYVLNAIYFKAIWADKFDKDNTRKEQFTTAANIKKDVQMMNKTADYGYMETDTYQAVRLPYGNGAYSMVVLLPKASAKLCEVLAGMDGAKWKTLTSSMHEREVILKLPRFEIDTSTDLIDLLKNLGIVRAFDAFNAEFDKIADSGTLFISKMKQLARIEVNEEGTKAAAVTIAEMSYTTSVGPGPLPVEFYADHPFAYFITEQSSGAIFFMGTYEAPSNSPV